MRLSPPPGLRYNIFGFRHCRCSVEVLFSDSIGTAEEPRSDGSIRAAAGPSRLRRPGMNFFVFIGVLSV